MPKLGRQDHGLPFINRGASVRYQLQRPFRYEKDFKSEMGVDSPKDFGILTGSVGASQLQRPSGLEHLQFHISVCKGKRKAAVIHGSNIAYLHPEYNRKLLDPDIETDLCLSGYLNFGNSGIIMKQKPKGRPIL